MPTMRPIIEVRSGPWDKWPLVVYLDGMAVKIILESGVVRDVDPRETIEKMLAEAKT